MLREHNRKQGGDGQRPDLVGLLGYSKESGLY